MATPYLTYPVMWRMKVTDRMASEVNLAAAVAGSTRQAWLRAAIDDRLARDRKQSGRSR